MCGWPYSQRVGYTQNVTIIGSSRKYFRRRAVRVPAGAISPQASGLCQPNSFPPWSCKLATIPRTAFIGMLAEYGILTTDAWRRPHKMVLINDVRDAVGNMACEHIRFNFTLGFEVVGFNLVLTRRPSAVRCPDRTLH